MYIALKTNRFDILAILVNYIFLIGRGCSKMIDLLFIKTKNGSSLFPLFIHKRSIYGFYECDQIFKMLFFESPLAISDRFPKISKIIPKVHQPICKIYQALLKYIYIAHNDMCKIELNKIINEYLTINKKGMWSGYGRSFLIVNMYNYIDNRSNETELEQAIFSQLMIDFIIKFINTDTIRKIAKSPDIPIEELSSKFATRNFKIDEFSLPYVTDREYDMLINLVNTTSKWKPFKEVHTDIMDSATYVTFENLFPQIEASKHCFSYMNTLAFNINTDISEFQQLISIHNYKKFFDYNLQFEQVGDVIDHDGYLFDKIVRLFKVGEAYRVVPTHHGILIHSNGTYVQVVKKAVGDIPYDHDINYKFLNKTIRVRSAYFIYEIFMIKPNRICSSDKNTRVEVKILGSIGMNTFFDIFPQSVKRNMFGNVTDDRRKILASAYECYIRDPHTYTKNLEDKMEKSNY